jgi:hypothetical protein
MTFSLGTVQFCGFCYANSDESGFANLAGGKRIVSDRVSFTLNRRTSFSTDPVSFEIEADAKLT